MNKDDKLQQLRRLNESTLRRDVLIPLLGRMGLRAVGEYHGTREHGKDIVCFDVDRLGQRRYLGIVAKITDLTGSVSSSSGLMEVLRQAEQCFNEPFYDLFGMRKITMDEVWIVTAGRVVPGAGESVFESLQKTNLAKLTRIIPGEHLVEIVDEHYPTYWNAAAESPDQVHAQRDRILSFLRGLLRKLGASHEQESTMLAALTHSAWAPRIETVSDIRGSIVRANPYSLMLSTAPSRYPQGLASDQCGDLNRALRSAQQAVFSEVVEIEELLENAEKALATADPREFLEICDSKLQEGGLFDGSCSSDLQCVGYLSDGLNDVHRFLNRIEAVGKRERYLQLVSSIESLEPDVAEYLRQVETPQFLLTWEIHDDGAEARVICRYSHGLAQGAEGFSTSHDLEVPTYKSWGVKTRPVSADDVTESAQLALRKYFEQVLRIERDDDS